MNLKINKLTLLISLLAIILAFSLPVFAHKIILYAYIEGDQIIAEGGFGDGSPAKNAEITVYNQAGDLLASGKTDENGISEITIPQKTDLKLKMNAGMGHQAEYSLAASELPEINNNDKIKAKSESELTVSNSLSENELRQIISQELAKKLQPIKKSLIKAEQNTGPGFTEIIGGIGYIFGLMGVVMYFKSKKE